LRAGMQYLQGQRENHNVYWGSNGFLFLKYTEPTEALKKINFSSVNRFAQMQSIPVYFSLIPDSSYVYERFMPAYSLNGNEALLFKAVPEYISDAEYIDLEKAFLHTGQTDLNLYYRTDHHWTTGGAYLAYQKLMENMGYTPLPLTAFEHTVLSDNFYGTLRAHSGAWWIAPDRIDGYTPEGDVRVEIYEENKLELTLDSYFAQEHLQTSDQYRVFLDGNHAQVIIHTGNKGKKLLLVKDSFAHSLVPFLAAHYSEIHMVDLRYYKVDYNKYVMQNGLDEALILYSADNFSTDSNLVFLPQTYE